MRLKDITIFSPQYVGDNIDGDVSFVPMESLRNGTIDYKTIPFLKAKGKYTYFGNQDLLIAKVTPCFENGNIAIARNLLNGIGFGSSEIFVLRPNKEVISQYLFYLSQSRDFQDKACATMCGVGGLKRISPLFMRTYEFDMPSIENQQRMVTYLDTKLSEIDHQVSLLTSKRDAYLRLKKSIINHAVTHGLDPNVKMKDSGIEWIGEVPEHWEMCRFKDAFRRWTTGITPDSKNYKYFESDICKGYTWVTISDFLEKYISQSSLNLSDESIKLFMPPLSLKGSLMFSFKLSVGKIAFADKDLYTNEAIVSIPPNNGQCLEYYYYMLPNVLHENATENIYGAKMLNQKIIANMLMVVPPLPEQRAIATCLDDKCAKIDTIVSNLGKQISRYGDLKRSLIDEVITGKRAV